MKPEGGMLVRVRLSELLGLIRRIFTPQCNAAKHTANHLQAERHAAALAFRLLPKWQHARLTTPPSDATKHRDLSTADLASQQRPTDREPNVRINRRAACRRVRVE